MERWHEPDAFRRGCALARDRGQAVALVPTMGALHEGHLALVAEARKRAGFVAVSIFVNPIQFGPNEDFSRYPRRLEADLAKCEAAGVDGVFAPDVSVMVAPGDETRVRVGATAAELCGMWRPGHFEGVTTIVAKFFALAGPCVAVFGRKDYQQLRVIARMAKDLLFPVEVVGLRTIRDPDGLALSSRNAYLGPAERAAALTIPRALSAAVAAFARGERKAGALTSIARGIVAPSATSIDYIEVADPEDIRVFAGDAAVGDRALLAIAARFNGVRLIDNVVLGEDAAPIPVLDARRDAGLSAPRGASADGGGSHE